MVPKNSKGASILGKRFDSVKKRGTASEKSFGKNVAQCQKNKWRPFGLSCTFATMKTNSQYQKQAGIGICRRHI